MLHAALSSACGGVLWQQQASIMAAAWSSHPERTAHLKLERKPAVLLPLQCVCVCVL